MPQSPEWLALQVCPTKPGQGPVFERGRWCQCSYLARGNHDGLTSKKNLPVTLLGKDKLETRLIVDTVREGSPAGCTPATVSTKRPPSCRGMVIPHQPVCLGTAQPMATHPLSAGLCMRRLPGSGTLRPRAQGPLADVCSGSSLLPSAQSGLAPQAPEHSRPHMQACCASVVSHPHQTSAWGRRAQSHRVVSRHPMAACVCPAS